MSSTAIEALMASTAIEAVVSTVERAQQRSLMREQERAKETARDRARQEQWRPAELERPAAPSIGLDWRPEGQRCKDH